MSNILERAKALCDDIDRDLRLGVILLDREKTSSGIIAELIAECERLENASASAKTRSIERRNLFADMEKDRNEWRKIAIEERARVLALEHVLSLMLPVQSIRPALETAADHMPAFRPRAEKELMAIEQQAKEIKRLQATLAGRELTISEFQDCATKQAARIAELEAEAQSLHDRKEEFAGHLTAANQRIDKLEGWLIEERANLIEAGGESSKPRLLPEDQKCLDDLARQQLISEGKIGPEDNHAGNVKMSSGQGLTKEQRAALDRYITPETQNYTPDQIDADRKVLRALLASPPAWEATAERIEALTYLVKSLYCTDKLEDCGKYPEDVLRAMLEEVKEGKP